VLDYRLLNLFPGESIWQKESDFMIINSTIDMLTLILKS